MLMKQQQGLFFDEQEISDVPLEAHDQFLDYIVTPTKTYSSTDAQTHLS